MFVLIIIFIFLFKNTRITSIFIKFKGENIQVFFIFDYNNHYLLFYEWLFYFKSHTYITGYSIIIFFIFIIIFLDIDEHDIVFTDHLIYYFDLITFLQYMSVDSYCTDICTSMCIRFYIDLSICGVCTIDLGTENIF